MRRDTRLVHAGRSTADDGGEVVAPIHLATTFEQRDQHPPRYFYGRGENRTREELERCLAELEDAAHALVLSSGQAAAASVLALLRPGMRLVASEDLYGGTFALLELASQQGIEVVYRDLSGPPREAVAGASLVWAETPTNPQLKVSDIAALADAAHASGALLAVDNTFAGPLLQQPLALGADISAYSTTKSMAGHSDVIGGALVLNSDEVHQRLLAYRTAAGNVPGPFDCFLVRRGLQTMGLRVARQIATARRLVEELERHPRVRALRYPGLESHPQHACAARQMSAPGAIVAFDYDGDPGDLLGRTNLWTVAVSLGSVRSLIECPAHMTHRPIPREQRLAVGITDQLIRLSPGIEDADDLWEDLREALG